MARTDPRPNYGTKRRIGATGYVDIYEPDHPLARRDGYVLEHRKILWDQGVLVDPSLHVHHRNGDKQDNRVENLQVLTVADHTRLHWETLRPTHCPSGHAFTDENTAFNPSGWRYCKQCNRDKARRYREARVSGVAS